MKMQFCFTVLFSVFLPLFIDKPVLAFSFSLPPLSSSCTTQSDYCLSLSQTIPNVGDVTVSIKPIIQLPSGGTQKAQQLLKSSVWAKDLTSPWTFVRGSGLTGSFNIAAYVPLIVAASNPKDNQVGATLQIFYVPNTDPSAGPIDPTGSNVHWIQIVKSNYAVISTTTGPTLRPFGTLEEKVDTVVEQQTSISPDFNPYYDTYARGSNSRSFFDRASRPIYDSINWTAELYLVEEYAPRQVRIYNGIQWGWTTKVVTQQPAKPPSKALPSKGPKSPSNPNEVCPPGMPTGSCIAFGYLDNSSANVLVDSSLLSFDEPSTPAVTSTNSQPDTDNTATVPEPSSMLGVLAVGAWAGISWRKRRNQQLESELVAESNT